MDEHIVSPIMLMERGAYLNYAAEMAAIRKANIVLDSSKLRTEWKTKHKQILTAVSMQDPILDIVDSDDCCGNCNEPQNDFIAAYMVTGMMTQSSWWRFSTDRFMAQFQANAANPKCHAHLLYLKTPGGEGTHLDLAAEMVRNSPKPTYGLIDSCCASGGMYLGSACKKLMATSTFDQIGSIGALVHFENDQPMYEQMGVEFTEIVATASTEKVRMVNAVLDGDQAAIDEYRTTIIDPFNDAFINFVKKARPNVNCTAEGQVFTGKVFFAQAAIGLGLIDGIDTPQNIIAQIQSEAVKTLTKNYFKY